ncbi:hypothetical protein RhiJN_25080 [Ceratobasidium sp. AG-Ba]|nr:hypothetical protein RhiJN_25080 [Ceratobasidium sp. AG-Ba]
MASANEFTVLVSEKLFKITRKQIHFDAPNYFTKRVLTNPPTVGSRIMELSRDAEMFQFILDYPSGYSAISTDRLVISCLPASRSIQDLLVDATFYELDKLKAICTRLLEHPIVELENQPLPKRYLLLHGSCNVPAASFADALFKGQHTLTTRFIPRDALFHPDFQNLTGMGRCTSSGPKGYRELSLLAKVVLTHLQSAGFQQRWSLIGWKRVHGNELMVIVDYSSGKHHSSSAQT